MTKVLLVEDAKIAQKIAEIILNELKCFVDIADTGARALELVKKENYDLIFIDLGLPDMDGLVVTETIKKMDSKKNIPVIALTVHDSDEMKRNCQHVGMNDFLEKPFSAESARHILEKYIHTSHFCGDPSS